MARRADTVDTHWNATCFGYGFGDFGPGQNASMTRFRALRQFNLNHLNLIHCGITDKVVRVKVTVFVSTAEIATANLPD